MSSIVSKTSDKNGYQRLSQAHLKGEIPAVKLKQFDDQPGKVFVCKESALRLLSERIQTASPAVQDNHEDSSQKILFVLRNIEGELTEIRKAQLWLSKTYRQLSESLRESKPAEQKRVLAELEMGHDGTCWDVFETPKATAPESVQAVN